MYSYSMSKGLFAGMSLEGAGLNVDESANQVYWGAVMSPKAALDKSATDKKIKSLIREINNLIAKAD